MNKMLEIGFIAEYININPGEMEDFGRGFFRFPGSTGHNAIIAGNDAFLSFITIFDNFLAKKRRIIQQNVLQ